MERVGAGKRAKRRKVLSTLPPKVPYNGLFLASDVEATFAVGHRLRAGPLVWNIAI